MINLEKIKDIINYEMADEELISIIFEMNRFYDSKLKLEYKKTQKQYGRVFNTFERNLLRNYYYYGRQVILEYLEIKEFAKITPTVADINNVIASCLQRIEKYDKSKIINSIIQRKNDLDDSISELKNSDNWMKWHSSRVQGKNNLVILNINQQIFDAQESLDFLFKAIHTAYDTLENYRYFSIIVDGEIFDKENINITWKVIYKVSIFAENFALFNDDFFPFKKAERISELNNFLKEKIDLNLASKLSKDFYQKISTGFKFEDFYIDNLQNKKVIIFKKTELDKTKVPCPSCMQTIESGNSFPEIFLRSWECKNPVCPSRSKSGRGKRFDEYSVYRYFKSVENSNNNIVDNSVYTEWRRDVFDAEQDPLVMLIKLYSWHDERVCLYNFPANSYTQNSREIIYEGLQSCSFNNRYIKEYDNLPIVQLLKNIFRNCKHISGNVELKDSIELINADSTAFLKTLAKNQIGAAITSPPYYNAREYSQWGNLLLYLIDMMLNAQSVYCAMDAAGTYLYNIGDIVARDNIYVKSNMSNRRLMLGNYSMMIFEIVGYHLAGNIIWDKGEVQSKRNSTINLMPGYVKCINCYEHVLVFKKAKINAAIDNKIVRIKPVFKINCKGENTYKHTAPFPQEIAALIKPYVVNNKYILDPFLGSGTTLSWCKDNNYKGIGIELNKEYFELAKTKLKNYSH